MNAELHREPLVDTIDKEKDEYVRMELMLVFYRPPRRIAQAIKEAYDSKEWDWKLSDGCTMSTELHAPPGVRFPPCVRHDYDCWRATQVKTLAEADKIRYEGDKLLYCASRAFGSSFRAAFRRFYGPRLYWLLWGRWFWMPPPKINIKLQ